MIFSDPSTCTWSKWSIFSLYSLISKPSIFSYFFFIYRTPTWWWLLWSCRFCLFAFTHCYSLASHCVTEEGAVPVQCPVIVLGQQDRWGGDRSCPVSYQWGNLGCTEIRWFCHVFFFIFFKFPPRKYPHILPRGRLKFEFPSIMSRRASAQEAPAKVCPHFSRRPTKVTHKSSRPELKNVNTQLFGWPNIS